MAKATYKVLSPIDIGDGRQEDGTIDLEEKVALPLVEAKVIEPVAPAEEKKPAAKK